MVSPFSFRNLPYPVGQAGSANATGDDQKKLDVLSNEMMVNSLFHSHVCCILVSEENDEPIFVPPDKAGRFTTPTGRKFLLREILHRL